MPSINFDPISPLFTSKSDLEMNHIKKILLLKMDQGIPRFRLLYQLRNKVMDGQVKLTVKPSPNSIILETLQRIICQSLELPLYKLMLSLLLIKMKVLWNCFMKFDIWKTWTLPVSKQVITKTSTVLRLS